MRRLRGAADLDDERWWGEDLDDGVRRLVLDDRLVLRNRRGVSGPGAARRRRGIGLRIGCRRGIPHRRARRAARRHRRRSRAFEVVHPGAIYLHQGQTYRVATLDLDDRAAIVEPDDGDEYTQVRIRDARRTILLDRSDAQRSARCSCTSARSRSPARSRATTARCAHGEVARPRGPRPAARRASSPGRSGTRSMPRCSLAARLSPEQVPGTLHAVEHAAIGMLPLFTICDRWDVGGVSTALQADTGAPDDRDLRRLPGRRRHRRARATARDAATSQPRSR